MSRRAPYFADGAGGWFLLPRSEVFTPRTLAAAMPMARAIVEGTTPRALGLETDDPAATTHELARVLATGEAVVCRIARRDRLLDEAEMVDLVDLVDPEEPERRPQVATWFEARIVDLHGVPIPDLEITWLHDGDREPATTDGDGVVRLEDARVRSAAISIASTAKLRSALTDAWARPSDGPPLSADDDVEVLYYRDRSLGPVLLSAETPRTLSIQPFVVLGRLLGMLFDTDRDFLLPIALPAIAELRDLYDRCEPKTVLVVGHTDTTAQPDYNAGLSIVRAQSVRAYLTDDVDAWLARYGDAVGRWGAAEDHQMLASLPDWSSRPSGEDPVRWFQRTRGLQVDGDAGEQTRRALITEYMQRDGTSLPAGVAIETHGCGEAFPLDGTGLDVDEAPIDGAGDSLDRRVEVFFFGDSLGVQPAPPGETSDATSSQYLSWRYRAQAAYEKVFGAQSLAIELRDDAGAPIPRARFTVTLPVGAVIDGELDDDGKATIHRLPAGIVHVDFPDLDRGFDVSGAGPLEGLGDRGSGELG